jgi:hypothetical protein
MALVLYMTSGSQPSHLSAILAYLNANKQLGPTELKGAAQATQKPTTGLGNI